VGYGAEASRIACPEARIGWAPATMSQTLAPVFAIAPTSTPSTSWGRRSGRLR